MDSMFWFGVLLMLMLLGMLLAAHRESIHWRYNLHRQQLLTDQWKAAYWKLKSYDENEGSWDDDDDDDEDDDEDLMGKPNPPFTSAMN